MFPLLKSPTGVASPFEILTQQVPQRAANFSSSDPSLLLHSLCQERQCWLPETLQSPTRLSFLSGSLPPLSLLSQPVVIFSLCSSIEEAHGLVLVLAGTVLPSAGCLGEGPWGWTDWPWIRTVLSIRAILGFLW